MIVLFGFAITASEFYYKIKNMQLQYKYLVLGFITSLVGCYVYDSTFKTKENKNSQENNSQETIFDSGNTLDKEISNN